LRRFPAPLNGGGGGGNTHASTRKKVKREVKEDMCTGWRPLILPSVKTAKRSQIFGSKTSKIPDRISNGGVRLWGQGREKAKIFGVGR